MVVARLTRGRLMVDAWLTHGSSMTDCRLVVYGDDDDDDGDDGAGVYYGNDGDGDDSDCDDYGEGD
eukprot:7091210-Lingulodinium_polyedra.AAC.1